VDRPPHDAITLFDSLILRIVAGCRGCASARTRRESASARPGATHHASEETARSAELHWRLVAAGAAVVRKKVRQQVRRFRRIGVLQMEYLHHCYVFGTHVDGMNHFRNLTNI